jgi:hypothetical protein
MVRFSEGEDVDMTALADDWNIYQLINGAEWLIALFKLNPDGEMPMVVSCSPLITPTH